MDLVAFMTLSWASRMASCKLATNGIEVVFGSVGGFVIRDAGIKFVFQKVYNACTQFSSMLATRVVMVKQLFSFVMRKCWEI